MDAMNTMQTEKEVRAERGHFWSAFGKRNLIIAGTVLLIGAAIVVNWMLFSGSETVDGKDGYDATSGQLTEHGDKLTGGDGTKVGADEAGDSTASYFAATQVNRQRARDEAIEVLQSVVDSASSDDAMKAQALADITQIAKDMETEANIETLIKSKGFADCVAVINGDTASIVVKSEGLLASQISQINEIVYEQAGISPVNITIIQK